MNRTVLPEILFCIIEEKWHHMNFDNVECALQVLLRGCQESHFSRAPGYNLYFFAEYAKLGHIFPCYLGRLQLFFQSKK